MQNLILREIFDHLMVDPSLIFTPFSISWLLITYELGPAFTLRIVFLVFDSGGGAFIRHGAFNRKGRLF